MLYNNSNPAVTIILCYYVLFEIFSRRDQSSHEISLFPLSPWKPKESKNAMMADEFQEFKNSKGVDKYRLL